MPSNRPKYLLAALLALLCSTGGAQNATDSISIFTLMEAVEENTGCRIYTTIEQPFLVKKTGTLTPGIEHLQKALSGTLYQVSTYQDRIYVLPSTQLETSLPSFWQKGRLGTGNNGNAVQATSENKVYDIGDKYKPSGQKRITLSGEIIDFRSGEPMMGVNIILRDPWTATVTDLNGHFTLSLPAGHNTLEISGLNIKDTQRQFMLYADGTAHIILEEQEHLLDEVVVVSGRVENVKGLQLGMEKFQRKKAQYETDCADENYNFTPITLTLTVSTIIPVKPSTLYLIASFKLASNLDKLLFNSSYLCSTSSNCL